MIPEMIVRETKLLKRREIIKLWQAQGDSILDSYACPRCRDILQFQDGFYFCENNYCKDLDDNYATFYKPEASNG